MLRTAAVLGLSAALLVPGAAWAQQGSVCPNVFFAYSAEDQKGPPNVPVTLKGGSDVQPAKTPDRWTLTRVSPGPAALLDTDEGTPDFSLTFTATETTTVRIEAVGPAGCGPTTADFTRTVTSSSPSPTPTQTPHQDPECPTYTVTRPVTPLNVGDSATITATVAEGQRAAQFALQRNVPSPAAVVRFSEVPVKTVTWTVRLGESHRLAVFASYGPGGCIGGGTGAVTVDIPVRPSLSINAVRNAPRDYSFTGRILPGRGQLVTLYRHTAEGARVLTSQSRVQSNGLYRFDRRFTGSGRFGFSVAVGNSATNLAGESRVRPTVIH